MKADSWAGQIRLNSKAFAIRFESTAGIDGSLGSSHAPIPLPAHPEAGYCMETPFWHLKNAIMTLLDGPKPLKSVIFHIQRQSL